jgi:sodium/potassium-transporting ATPase subunit alpha
MRHPGLSPGNALILWGVAAEAGLLLAINFTPWGRDGLATEALAAAVWAFMLPFAVAMLVLEEGRQAQVRRMDAAQSAPAGA